MFRRLILEDQATLFTIVAFVTAVAIFCSFAWRALRMNRPQQERLANLPFDADPSSES
jgi:hypothetical protein